MKTDMNKQQHQQSAHAHGTSLWRLTEGQRVRYGGAIVAMAVSNVFLFGAPMIGKFAIDVASSGDVKEGWSLLRDAVQLLPGADDRSSSEATTGVSLAAYLWASALLSILITAIAGAFQYLRGRWTAMASEAITEKLRLALYQRLHHARAQFFDHAETGDLVQRCSSDVDNLQVFLSTHVVAMGRSLLLIISVLPVLIWMNLQLAVWSLCLMPLLVVGAYVFFRRIKALFQQADEAEGRMSATLQENLTGIRVVRAFNRQACEIDKFAACNGEFRDNNYRVFVIMSYFWSISDFIAITQLGIVLIGGAWFVRSGVLSVGELFAFMTYVGMVIWPIRHIGSVLADAGKAVVSLGRVNHILRQAPEKAGIRPSKPCAASGRIRIHKLRFHYASESGGTTEASSTANDAYAGNHSQHLPILDGISIDIDAGETIGIVGAPGCGKTSLVRLLLKFYDYQSGSIQLDGVELRDLDRQWLRQQIAVVFQEPFLYSRSISGNLLVGQPDASDADIRTACQHAALHDSIEQFPRGYDALVGERGVTLSGGQRQRLALSRALLKKPPILILDDSLSAVDTGTEQQILDALRARQGRCTTLIIAHRLSSVRHTDRIMVLDAGRIAQLGSHDELAMQPGQYRRLCDIQGELDASIQADLNVLVNT